MNTVATTRAFLRNLSILTAGDLAAKLLIFLAIAHIARVLGTGLFGDLAFASALTLYFGLIVTQGLDIFAIQEVARDHTLAQSRAASILGLRLVSSIAAIAALALTAQALDKPAHLKTLLLLYGLSFLPSAMSLQWVFQATERMKYVAVSGVLSQLVFSGMVVSLLRSPSQLLWIPVFQFAGEVVSAVYLILLYRRHFGPIRFAFRIQPWAAMLRESIPIGLSAALSLLMYNFDMVLLGFLKPAPEVGQYNAAYKVIAFFSSFILVYNRNLFPSVSRCRSRPEALLHISERTQRYVLLLSIPLAAGGTLVAGPLMDTIFGRQYREGAIALGILIWTIPVAASRVLYRITLVSHGMQNPNLWISLSAVAVNVVLNFALIPRYSYTGSAAASVIAELILLGLTHRFVARRVIPLPYWKHVWKPALTCVPMAVFLAASGGVAVAVRIAAGFLIYVATGLALKVFDFGEMREMIRSLRRDPDAKTELS